MLSEITEQYTPNLEKLKSRPDKIRNLIDDITCAFQLILDKK
jgi:hypothetical protein